MYRVGRSNIVTWDEAHFGKFGSHYLKREFYFDVHPPLGKMLVGLSGYLAGYNGSFEFKSGDKFPEEINYTFMRTFNAMFGAMCVPLAYSTARALNFRTPTVWLISLMVLFENSYATISRFILLDSMLLCFTFTTVMCWAKFHRLQHASFSPAWFTWLFLTGLSIGCVCSVKLVGLFCTAIVGLYTAEDLWNKFGDLRISEVSLKRGGNRPPKRKVVKKRANVREDHFGQTPSSACSGPDCYTDHGLYVFLLSTFQDSRKQWAWGCTNELALSSKS